MEMSGDQWVPLAREKVWEALNDPDVLKACVPGCQSVEKESENQFTATVNAKVGPVKSRFKGNVTLSDLNPPTSYTLTFQGQGAAGFTKGEANVSLADEGEGTRISYTAHATIGGKLAQVGARLVDGAARKMANEFFGNLTEHLGGTVGQGGEAAGTEGASEPEQEAEASLAEGSTPGGATGPAEDSAAPAEQPSETQAAPDTQPQAGSAAGPTSGDQAPREEFPGGSNQVWVWILVAVVIVVVAWLLLR